MKLPASPVEDKGKEEESEVSMQEMKSVDTCGNLVSMEDLFVIYRNRCSLVDI